MVMKLWCSTHASSRFRFKTWRETNGFNQNFISESKNLDSYDRLDELVQIVGKNAKHNLTTEEIKSIASIYLSDNIDFKSLNLKVTMII